MGAGLKFLRARFSREGYLGLHLTIGAAVVLLGAAAFSELVRNLGAEQALVRFDHRTTEWFHAHIAPTTVLAARAVSFFGSVGFLTVATAALALLLTRREMWNRLLILLHAVPGGALLNLLLKHIFHRQRPVFENPVVTLSSYGFPSGHTMGATIFYGLLALLLAAQLRSGWRRAAVVVCGFVLIALIGLSRIALGAHFASDVAGAFVAGSAWLAFCWTALEVIRRLRQAPRH